MSGITTTGDPLHPADPKKDLSKQIKHARSVPPSVSNFMMDKIAPIPEDDLYGANEDFDDNKKQILEDVSSKEKKKKIEFEETTIEETPPPPYAPAIAAAERVPLWKRRWFLLAAICGLLLLIIVLAVSLGVELSKKSSNAHNGSSSGSSGTLGPSSPTSNPSSPTSPTHGGNASPPMRNTAISAATIPDIYSADRGTTSTPLVQIFFQDKDLYLCSKTSTSGVESWPLSDNGSRIVPAHNSTPITVTYGGLSDGYLPIRVFFINANGHLADIYQSTWGGPWTNGSLSERQFTVAGQSLSITLGSNSISAAWCADEVGPTVYAMGTDWQLYAFQISGYAKDGSGGSWNVVWQADGGGGVTAVNIAAFCLMPADWPPPLFVNAFDLVGSTGQLVSWFNTTNVTVPLPSTVATLYLPDTPIAAVYGMLPSASGSTSLGLLLFFPLPASPSNLSPNPSIHMLSAEPYWSSHQQMQGSNDFYATQPRLNWTNSLLTDTGIVPYARGSAALFSGLDASVSNNIMNSMPRAWTPLFLQGKDTGRVVVVYQGTDLTIRIADVVGGSGSYRLSTVWGNP